ncbi:MAG TPA: carboxypeptidase regulatory-like domain-containing protein [Gemmatimonadaceae bacterium]|nr:carboxypeptidase regulatory-like domain-containing protein [Gemmatimonadaceae bacterium]
MKSLAALAVCLTLALAPAPGVAQVGSTTDIVMGRVTSPEGTPVAGARISVTSAETQITRTKTTDANGRYSLLFPDGGGAYRVQVIAIGYSPQTFSVIRQSDEDRLVRDVVLARTATVLQSVQVRAQPERRQGQRPEAGSTERGLPPAVLNRLPVEAGDLNAVATLAPGVIGIAATDSTPASFSVAGQAADQNSITLDGLSFASGTLPQEAIRTTRVITSTYDVARGQFTGGQVASTTRGGTNSFQGGLNYSLRDPSLEFVEEPENAFSQKFTQNSINGGFGGPIVRDKVFAFGAASFSRRTDPVQSLLAADPLALQRLGTNADSVTRFIALLNRFGLRPTIAGIPDDRLNNNGSALLRMDFTLGEAHNLMLRGDWRGAIQDASRISAFSVPHSGGSANSQGGGGMIMLTSHWSLLINEFRAYSTLDVRKSDPYVRVPSGRVTVASNLSDGSVGVSTLQFGVNPSLPQETRTGFTEITDELSLVTRNASHRIKLGGFVNEDRSRSGSFSNALGTFTFNSLEDFEEGTPASFTRTLATKKRESRSINSALYLGDSWRSSPQLQFVYGLRLESSAYPDAPEYNPAADSLFAVRTDLFPTEVHVSPRAGFTYTFGDGQSGPAVATIRGGFGEFRGRAASQLFASASNANGLANAQSQIVCVGSTVPLPDWQLFNANPAAVPAACNGTSQQFGNQRRNIAVFNEDFHVPRVWRASLGANRRIAERYNFSLDASFAHGVAQTSARDMNLDAIPKFVISSEASRPVFAPPTSIVPATGAISLTGSRLQPRFGVVSQINSNLTSDTRQITAAFQGITTSALIMNASYTYTRSTDQAQGFSVIGGGRSGASTAGNPNRPERATSDQERRHSVVATVNWPITSAIELSAVGRLTSGGFFTPMVGGDINGDGIRNDRSFIYNRASAPDTAVANGMSRLLAIAPARARECLEAQVSSIAGRNSCSIPWSPSFDLQLNLKPASFGLQRRLTVSFLGINTLAGIDQLLHGKDIHGWGQPVFPDVTLLYVRGFDPETRRFQYQVNEHFGAANGSRNAFRVPFQVAVQGRLSLGADQARQQMNAMFGARAGANLSVEEFRERLAHSVRNPVRKILDLNDSAKLELTEEQKARLSAMGDSLQAKADTIIDKLAETLGGRTARNADPVQLNMKMRTGIQDARNLVIEGVKAAHKVLTPEQWARLPEDVRNAEDRRPDERQQREGQQGGRRRERR